MDTKGYGIATRPGSGFKDLLDQARTVFFFILFVWIEPSVEIPHVLILSQKGQSMKMLLELAALPPKQKRPREPNTQIW